MIAYLYICFVIDQVGIFKEYLKNYQNDNSERINTIFMIQLWPFYGGNTDFEQLGMIIQIYIIKLLLNKRFNDFKNSFYDNRKF